MTAIPPVEVRQVRPCSYMYYGCCMHYDDYNESCRIGDEVMLSFRDHMILDHPVSKIPLNTEENQNLFDEVNREAARKYPCKYNLSRAEYRELIDQHNAGEHEIAALREQVKLLQHVIERQGTEHSKNSTPQSRRQNDIINV